MVSFDDVTEAWNRACMEGGGPRPGPGDQALADLLLAHGRIRNGGFHHGVLGLTAQELSAAIAGYEYFGFRDLAAFLGSLPAHHTQGEWTAESETIAEQRYRDAIPYDGALDSSLKRALEEHPEDFAPLG